MAGKLLAEWLWIDRWTGSSAFLLPMEIQGLYHAMLMQSWRRGGSLPNDHEAIQRATGCTTAEWDRCWPRLSRYWKTSDDGLTIYNETQREVMAESLARLEANAERAKRAADARWNAPSNARSNAPRKRQAKLKQSPPVSSIQSPDLSPEGKSDASHPPAADAAGEPLRLSSNPLIAVFQESYRQRHSSLPVMPYGRAAKELSDIAKTKGLDADGLRAAADAYMGNGDKWTEGHPYGLFVKHFDRWHEAAQVHVRHEPEQNPPLRYIV